MSSEENASGQSPFHRGEQLIQTKVGLRDEMESFGRKVIRDSIPEQHRAFYVQLPFATVGHVDSAGRPWASLLVGRPGFLSTPNARSMHFATCPVAGDPLATSLSPGLPLGFLGMDPATRRRNRLTGRVISVDPDGFSLEVDQAFGNCPQYIQTRAIEFVREPNQQYDVPPVVTFTRFDKEARTMIECADTFFVASASSDEQRGSVGGADASHRGGLPGFVGVEDNGTLVIPDYSGNNHFNTLGNFIVNPKAGLLFVDFETGDLLMLSGTVEIVWEGPEVDSFRGAERLWKFRLTHGMRLRDRLPVRWSLEESSPHNTLTGTWAEARATREADAARKAWRPYRVTRVVDESDEIRSFYLVPDDGGALPTFRAGQHLPIRVTPVTGAAPVLRTYTLSSAPGDVYYRISIKREAHGLVSQYLHDSLREGDVLEARAPQGHFVFDAGELRPAVLLSGGVGVTPMISMLRHVAKEGFRTRYWRPTTFVHAARTTAGRAFFDEARQLVEASDGAMRLLSVIGRPSESDRRGRDYHHHGRVDKVLLNKILALADYDFFLCGPGPFMQAMYDALRELGVRDSRIFAEAFGPSALSRQPDAGAGPGASAVPAADNGIVEFAEAQFEIPWTPNDGTLLELAESHGLTPDFSCRAGSCGSCAVRVISGEITYTTDPSAPIPEGHVLLCCAVPAKIAEEDEASRVVLGL